MNILNKEEKKLEILKSLLHAVYVSSWGHGLSTMWNTWN